ncbi:MAG: c-type cytochrome domain-containing protein [Verrucomicrobiota bacterium]
MVSSLLLPQVQKTAAALVFTAFAAALISFFIIFPQGSAVPLAVKVSGNFHPLILHLPIGMLLGAVVLDIFNGPGRRHESAVNWLLWLGLLTGAVTALFGYFLGIAGDYAKETLTWHMWTGISVPVLTFLTLLAKLHYDQKQPHMSKSLYRVPLFTTATAVMVAGHFGGTLSHGDILKDVKVLISSRSTSGPSIAQAVETRTVYDAIIAPLMAKKCTSCHGEEKQKGDLQLHTLEAMLKAGESEKSAIIPGSSATSESIVRLLLPLDHEEHMPPEGKAQLNADEQEVLRWWIDAGARKDLKISDPQIPSAVQVKMISLAVPGIALAPGAHGDTGPAGEEGKPGAPAAAGAAPAPDMAPVQALEKELGVAILPLAQNDAALTFNCVNVADKFGDAELAKFAPLADRMSEMNLGRSKVTDAGLATLSGMKNLKKLHLPNTVVTDAGIDALLPLASLEYLNLFNTKVTDAGLAKLEKLPKLKRLYVWQTGVTKPAAEALHTKLPEIVINLGWDNEVKSAVAAVPAAVAAAAAPTVNPAPAAAADPEQPVYVALIQPIFVAKCAGCHGEDKKKGKFQMHTFEALMKNGDSGKPAVVAGKSGDSLIIQRALLPKDEDEHMPPSNKDQLTDKELGLIKWWIDSGAKTDVKLKDAGLPDNLK